jgi:hypothetical protein
VLANLAELEPFARLPWTSGYVQGIIDASYLNLTPGTRLGVIHDAQLARLADELAPLEARLGKIIEDQQRAEEERTSRDVLRSVQGALKEALLALPAEEYDWFDLHRGEGRRWPRAAAQAPMGEATSAGDQSVPMPAAADIETPEPQRHFFEFAGPLFSVVISPTSSVVEVAGSRRLRAIARDRARRTVEQDLTHLWRVLEGDGTLESGDAGTALFRAADEPGLARVEVVVTQGIVAWRAEAQITVSAACSPRNWCSRTSLAFRKISCSNDCWN